ncbi:MAG: DUF2887 domain-containing protein, partial [Microcystis sp.]
QSSQRQLINLIESIIIYKLPQKSREEIEAMFGLSDLKQTRVYLNGARGLPLNFSLIKNIPEINGR